MIRNNIQRFQTSMRKKIDQSMQKNLGAFTDLVNEIADSLDSKQPRMILNFALDLIKPYLRAIGLRVSRLSEDQIEVVVPVKFRNQGEADEIDEGILCSSGIFAFRQLWKKNSPQGKFNISIKKISFEKIRDHQFQNGHLLIRFEIPVLVRESIFAHLYDQGVDQPEFTLFVYDQSDLMVAEIRIAAELTLNKTLERK